MDWSRGLCYALTPLDFFLRGEIENLVYDTPIDLEIVSFLQ